MPVTSRQNLAETDRGLHYDKEEWLEKSWDGKGGFPMVMKVMIVIMMMRIIIKIRTAAVMVRFY